MEMVIVISRALAMATSKPAAHQTALLPAVNLANSYAKHIRICFY
jgi:hypothetical protein